MINILYFIIVFKFKISNLLIMNHHTVLFLILCLSILYAFHPIILKSICKGVDIKNIILIKLLITSLIGVGIYLYLIINDQKQLKEILNCNKKTAITLFFLILLEYVAISIYLKTLKHSDVSWTVPILEGGIILFSVILAYILFNDNITINKILGILLIIIGIYVVYKN